ncbi:MAG: hypothetical protein U1G07_17740 [Verrucomicrobiota bacterium]
MDVLPTTEMAQAILEDFLRAKSLAASVGAVQEVKVHQLLTFLSCGVVALPFAAGDRIYRLLLMIKVLPRVDFHRRTDQEKAIIGDCKFRRYSIVTDSDRAKVFALAEYVQKLRSRRSGVSSKLEDPPNA